MTTLKPFITNKRDLLEYTFIFVVNLYDRHDSIEMVNVHIRCNEEQYKITSWLTSLDYTAYQCFYMHLHISLIFFSGLTS